jgi:hypothetical protein
MDLLGDVQTEIFLKTIFQFEMDHLLKISQLRLHTYSELFRNMHLKRNKLHLIEVWMFQEI